MHIESIILLSFALVGTVSVWGMVGWLIKTFFGEMATETAKKCFGWLRSKLKRSASDVSLERGEGFAAGPQAPQKPA